MGKVQLEEEKEQRVNLKLITGGKDGEGSGNWLLDMELGSLFFVKDKRDLNNPLLGEFVLVMKDGNIVALTGPDIPGEKKYFDPRTFVNRYSLHRNVGVLFSKEEETEKTDEQGDRVPGDGEGKA